MPSTKDLEKEKNKRAKITIEMKLKIIEKYKQGLGVSGLGREYNLSKSTISTILKNKDKLGLVNAAKGVSRISSQRPQIMDDLERLLLIWINEKQMQGDSISQNIICEKAKTIFTNLIEKLPGTSTVSEKEFKASKGWFENFKKRTGIHNVMRHGEASSSDAKAAESFVGEFKKLVDTAGFLPQQIFNCDETGLFWKKMPNRTYITAEEEAMPGHKPMKDRLTLLLCSNASGDLKIKPLLVYHSENPRAFKKHNVDKSKLNVMWKSNSKAWVTRDLFTDWINNVFGPSVQKYLIEKDLPLRALLIMDNAPSHPPSLQDDLIEELKFIKIHFLPPNTTPLLQPMDQQVISNFKKLYTKELFQHCFEVTEKTNLTLKEFWKDHFHIVGCLKIIETAWNGVTKRTLESSWKKLWPEHFAESTFEELDAVSTDPITNEIISLAEQIGLEVDSNDIAELVAEHNEDLTTEDLVKLQCASEQEVEQSTLSDEEITEEPQSSSAIREMLNSWESVASYIKKHHPNQTVAIRATELFNDNAVSHFQQILKRRQKQTTLDSFLLKEK